MSRSNNTELINPAVRFFEWAGGEGTIRYFDKTLGEKGENVEVALPFKFLVLDKVSQVTGGIDRDGSYQGYWSNAVKNTKTQQFVVRSRGGIEVQGLYENIKNYPGAKFMTGLYIAFYDENENLQIGYLKIKGAALTSWIEFTKSHKNIYEGAFGIEGKTKQKKGATVYYEPTFKHYPKITDETEEAAKQLDVHLQEYLTAYFAQNGLAEVEAQYSGQAAAATVGGGPSYLDNEPDMPMGDAYEPPVDFNEVGF